MKTCEACAKDIMYVDRVIEVRYGTLGYTSRYAKVVRMRRDWFHWGCGPNVAIRTMKEAGG
jgi:hypothetical protein